MNIGRWRAVPAFLMVLVLTLLGCSGCAGVRIYSDVRDKQGVSAKEAWAKVDFKALVDTERANLKKLLDAEMETQDQLAASIRDYELKAMVGSATLDDGLLQPVDARIVQLAGSVGQLEAAALGLGKRKIADSVMISAGLVFTPQGVPVPTCAQLKDGATPKAVKDRMENPNISSAQRAGLKIGLEQLRAQCLAAAAAPEDAAFGQLGGEIETAWARYVADREALKTQQQQAQLLQQDYKTAQAAYDAALAKATTDASAVNDVKTAAEKLAAVVKALEDGGALSAKFIAKEKLDSLDAFLKAVIETPPGAGPPKDASKALVVFIAVPELYDNAAKALAEAKRPLAVPLLLRRNHEQLNFEAASRHVAASEAMVQASRDVVEALYQQAQSLALAKKELSSEGVAAMKARKLQAAFDGATGDDRTALYSGAARYLDAVNRLDAKRYKLEYKRVAAIHERSLAYAEVNLKQWSSLIGVTVDQVAASGASGIKSETITNLLNTVGVFYIGAGVNK